MQDKRIKLNQNSHVWKAGFIQLQPPIIGLLSVSVLYKEVRATFTPSYFVPSVYPPSRRRIWGELRKTIVVIGSVLCQRREGETVEETAQPQNSQRCKMNLHMWIVTCWMALVDCHHVICHMSNLLQKKLSHDDSKFQMTQKGPKMNFPALLLISKDTSWKKTLLFSNCPPSSFINYGRMYLGKIVLHLSVGISLG